MYVRNSPVLINERYFVNITVTQTMGHVNTSNVQKKFKDFSKDGMPQLLNYVMCRKKQQDQCIRPDKPACHTPVYHGQHTSFKSAKGLVHACLFYSALDAMDTKAVELNTAY